MRRRLPFFSNLFDANEVDPESRNRLLLTGGIAAIVVIAFALIATGYYFDRIASRGDTVFRVGERSFTYAYLEDRVDAAVAGGSFANQDIQTGIANVVTLVQTEELVRLTAREKGYTVTEEELELAIRDRVGSTPEASRNAFARLLRIELSALGLSLERYEEIVEAELLQERLRADIEATIPAEGEQVDLLLIQVATEALAIEAKERVEGGEDFGSVAIDMSQHATRSIGGSFGWTPMRVLPDDIEEAAFALEPETPSEVLGNDRGFFVMQIQGKETRELTAGMKEDILNTEFAEMLDVTQEQYGMVNLLTVGQAQRLAGRIGSTGG